MVEPFNSQVFAQNAINFLNQPSCRPSMVSDEGRRIAEAYGSVLQVLEMVADGRLILSPPPESAPTAETPTKAEKAIP